jgi:nucleotide-binding universal stress UspA family protein
MFERALVALDLAPSGDVLAGCAPELHALGVRRLTLLHVAAVDYPVAGAVAHLDSYRETLEALAESLRNRDFVVTTDVRPGNPAREILRATAEVGADLVLIGSRSRSRLREAFVGSVTLKVLEESHVPVLFLRIDPDGEDDDASLTVFCCPMDGPILLATDFSPAAEAAASVALALARKGEGRPITVLHATEGQSSVTGAGPVSRREDPLEELALQLRAGGVATVETRLAEKEPAEAVLAAAGDEAPLLVMGNRGKGLLRRMVLGSVARDVIGHIRSPVLLVPEA